MDLGWISIHRKLKEHWLWQDPVKLKWWLDILLTVNHSDAKVNIGFELYECKRGQSVRSLQGWGEAWGVSKDSARNFLKLLEKDNMIKLENIGKSTRLTVCKYDSYQAALHDNQTQSQRKANAKPTRPHANNNENNENNDNNENKPAKISFCHNVKLLKKEHEALVEKYGQAQTDWMIDKLSNYKEANAKKYKSDYAAINSWVVNAAEKQFGKASNSYQPKSSLTIEQKNALFHG